MKKQNLILKILILTIYLGFITDNIHGQFSYNFTTNTTPTYSANSTPNGTPHLTSIDDAISGILPIGFTFSYGCNNYTEFRVSTNGWLTFNTTYTGSDALNELSTTSIGPVIAPLWDDLKTGSAGNVNYQLTGTAPNRILTVEWKSMYWYYLSSTDVISFQCKLYETTNVIEFIYKQGTAAVSSASASIGIAGPTTGEFYSLNGTGGSPVASNSSETTTLSVKPANNQHYIFTPPAACSGTPNAGTATPSPTSVCSGNNSTITLSGYSSGCGISYQWQSASAIGGPYSNISGATSVSYLATVTTDTYYRCVTSCSNGGGSNTSSVATVTLNAPTSCYCTPNPSSVDGTGITNINCGTINNTSGAESGNYGDYSAQVTDVVQGENATVNVTFSTGYTYVTKIWVDLNNDGDFVDTGEEVYSGTSTAANPTTLVAIFAVPGGTSLGNHRMRIGGADTGPPTPCYTGSFASFEDYTLNVTGATGMVFSSCTTTQTNTNIVLTGSTTQEIIGIQIVTTGSSSPLSATSFTVNANGTTAIADINAANSAKIYYTGTSSTFATTTLFGQNTPTISNFNITGSQTLSSGTNYFWLVYDIKPTATPGNVVDGECTSLTVVSARTPTVTAPAGNRSIIDQVTIGNGTSNSYTYPFTSYYDYGRTASIYTASEIGGLPTQINSLAWDISSTTTDNVPVKIYLKTTTASTLTSETWDNMIAGATLVYNGTVQFTPSGWKTFDITDFSYCSDNLLVLCESNNVSSPLTYTYFDYTSTGTYQNEYWSNSSTPPTGTGTTSYNRPNIQINKLPASGMSYTSCTTTQNNTSNVSINTSNQEVIGMQIITSGCTSPLSASSFTINITGTTAAADITNLKLWTTGTSSTFATATQLGATVVTPSGSHVITGGTNMPYTLSSGTNYFWVTYDVPAGSTINNFIDAQCTSITIGGIARTPTATSPAGNRKIVNEVVIGTGTSTGSYPFNTNWGYSRSASLFTSAEVGTPCLVTLLAWNIQTATTSNIPVKIYLKTTTASSLPSDDWANMIAGATLVYDATTQFTPTGWKSFDITDFNYCADNLIILCEANFGGSGAGSTVSFYYTTAGTATHETWTGDTSPPTGSGTTGTSRPNITITKSTAGVMSFTSCTTTQNNTSDVLINTTNQEVIGMQIILNGCTSPLTASSFTVNITGTTAAADITNLKLWTTGTSSTFATTTQLGATVVTPTGSHVITGGSNMPYTLSSGTNYFWVTYDIPFAATLNNIIDAQCTSITIGGTPRTPTTQNPAGSRPIKAIITIGTGTSTTTHPYCGNFEDARSQFIITASELTNAGLCAGSALSSLSYFVSIKNSTAQYKNYTLKIGHIGSTASFSSATWFTPTFTTVFSANYTTVDASWNTHTFTSNFTWNGSDNIVVEACYNNTAFTSYDYVYYTTASGSGCTAEVDGDIGCSLAAETTTSSRPNMKFNYVPGSSCSGTPAGGTASASPTSICAGQSTVLSLSGQTLACGITYQWQSSPDNSTWTSISGATTTTYPVSPVSSTYYKCVVTCTNSSLSSSSASQLVTVNGPAYATIPYATSFEPAWTSRCDTREIPDNSWVASPSTGNNSWRRNDDGVLAAGWGSITNGEYNPASSSGTYSARYHAYSTSTPGYLDLFINCSPAGTKTLTFDYFLNVSSSADMEVLLSTDGGASFSPTPLITVNQPGAWTPYSVDFTSNSATTVIRFKANGDLGSYDIGLDNVNILAPCTGTPTAGTASSVITSSTTCGGNAYDLTLSGQTIASGLTYQWQTSPNPITTWTNISGATSLSCTVAPSGAANYRCVVTCSNSSLSANSSSVLVTIPGHTCSNPVNVTLPYIKTGESTQCMNDNYSNTSTASCGSNYESGDDKVYKILVYAAGCVHVSLTNTSTTSIGFQVYDGCPDATGTNCIYNSTTGADPITYSLAADVNFSSAGYYYVIVDKWGSGSLDYDLSISAPSGNTSNDIVCNAVPLTLGVSAYGDNTCTNSSGEPATPGCWSSGAVNTVWYMVTVPASQDVAIQTTAGSLLNTQIAVYKGNDCNTLTYVDCNDDASSCGTSYQHSYLLVQNITNTYLYIRIDGGYDDIGTFTVTAIDGNNGSPVWPSLPGQDCGSVTTSTNPVCGQTTLIDNPGYFAFGNTCDFTGSGTCLATGERSAVWYTININGNGNLEFDIVPNDYGDPNPVTGQSNSGYDFAGDETDYDFAVWKWESACDGTGDGVLCCSEIASGSVAPLRCDYNSLGVTGLYGASDGTAPAAYSNFSSAYKSQIAVLNGETYIIVLSNYANDYVAGYSLVFSATSPVAYSTPGTTLTWASNTSLTWNSPGNWGGCTAPSCTEDAVVSAGGAQPVISSNATVSDLTINNGATLTINPGKTLTVCGDLIINGSIDMSPTSSLIFTGSATQNISGSLTGSNNIGNITIDKTGGSVILGAGVNIDIIGDFTTSNATSIFNVNNNMVKVAGNINLASGTTLINCPDIEFNGTYPQTFSNSSGTVTFTNVTMNNTGGGITLASSAASSIYVSGALTLTSGIIYTNSSGLLVMNSGSSVSGGSSSCFVDGPMQKIGNTDFVFPVGDAFNRWARIGISNLGASETFQAQYYYSAYTNTSSMASTPTPVVNNVSEIEYWQLDLVSAPGSADVTLYWENASSSGITSCVNNGDLVVSHFNGSSWENTNVTSSTVTGSCSGSSFGTITSNNITSFSPITFGSKTGSNPLPVEFVSFTGKIIGKINKLDWIVASETNNDYFTIERSSDGLKFEIIGNVDGSGNSNTKKEYYINDADPLEGMNYYRIRQTDFDGNFKYFPNVVSLEHISPAEYVIFPNPASDELMVYSTSLKEDNITFEILDISGRNIFSSTPLILKSSNHATVIDLRKFTEGIYFISINSLSHNTISKKKFVKLK